MNENENNSGFWLGLILGGAIGAVAGYLLHSEDKRKALEEIKAKGKLLLENLGNFKDEVTQKAGEVKKVVEAEVVEVVKEAKEAKSDVAEEMEGVPEAAREAIEKVEKAAEEAVKNISQSVKESSQSISPKKKGFGKVFFKKGSALLKK